MFKYLSILVSALAFTYAVPLGHSSDSEDSLLAPMNLGEMASIMMSTSMAKPEHKTETTDSVHSSHLIEVSKDVAVGAKLLPFETMAETGAVGGLIPAAAAIKGSVKGSAIATPIIVKAVALPGLAAGATAAFFSVPKLLENAKDMQTFLFHNVKSSVENSANNFEDLFIVEEVKTPESDSQTLTQIETHNENDSTFDLNKGIEDVTNTVGALKAGAVGLAAKGAVLAKKGAIRAGRLILKPIAILTGVHLKMLGSGLTLGGKLIGGTGAGIAKTGTVIKYAGLGSIGLGASAIGWGLDKSTIDTHFEESHRKFKI